MTNRREFLQVLLAATTLSSLPALLATFVRTGMSIMPFFRKTEISDNDLADLGAYLSSHPAR